MPVSTRRKNLSSVDPTIIEHAGLWLDRLLPTLPRVGEPVKRSPQAEHIAAAARIVEPAAYRPAFVRWAEALRTGGAALRTGVVEGRMVVGLGGESVLETAVTLHRVYGVPYIPGTALKGMAAAYARRFLAGEWAAGGRAYTTVFGTGGHSGSAGYITFYDALYIPGSSQGGRPLESDVLTVHHQDYYNMGGRSAPADWDSPNPVAFVSVTGAYLLALAGPSEAWVERTFELLGAAFAEIGVGAKTSSGYGRLSVRPYQGLSAPLPPSAAAQSQPPVSPSAPAGQAATAPGSAPAGLPAERQYPRAFTGKVLDDDDSVFIIQVPGFPESEVVAVLKKEPGVPKFKVGKDSAKVEVVAVRQTKSGKTILDVRRPPREAS